MLRNYLWVAARNLLKYRVFALINVIGLAVGVACCLILALYIHHEWVYDRHHPDAEKIYRIIRESTDEAGTQSFTNHTPGALNQALRGEVQGVQTSVRLMTRAGWMKTSERGFQERLCLADPEILDVFALPLIRGDRRTGLKSHGSIFVTESVARKYFGMADPLGLIVRADDFMFGGEYTITGVLKDLPETTLIQFDFLTSTAPGREVNGWQENDYLRNAWERWGGWPNENYAVLSSEAQPAQIEEQLTSFALRNSYAASQHHTRYHLQPITRAHLYPRQDYGFSPQGFLYRTNGDIRRLQVAVALGMFIFVLAGVNFVNLSTARFMLRAREVGMRKVVGARRSQIAGQFLGESILQSGLSHLLALAIAGLSLPHLSSWMGVTVTIEHPGWLWILILPTSVLITGVLAGMCPAFIISNFNPVAAVKADRVTGAGGVSLRRVLVVFQFSLSVLLIAGTWVVISQWRFMVAKDPGYNRENVVTLPYPVGDPEAVRQQFLANPKIMHASVTNNAPIRASYFFGRLLDQRLLDLQFGSGSETAVIDALSDYQNSEGGFGKGLEPDIQMEGSSVRTTTVGLQVLREIDTPPDHPVVRSAIRYLLETFDAGEQIWPIVPSEVDDDPHAPWWNHSGTKESFNGFLLNPTAEVLAHCYTFHSDEQPDLISQMTSVILERVEASPDAMEMHDLQCCVRLADTSTLPTKTRARLLTKLSAVADVEVTRNPKEWGKYTLKPLDVVFGPDSCLASLFKAEIEANLDWAIDHQGEDGAWSPPWSWGDAYPDVWPKARTDWQSHLTVSTLKILQDHGRTE